MIALVLAVAFSRPFHRETVASLHTSRHTHVEVCGTVILSKWEDDGDRHLRIGDALGHWIVAEIVPYHPLRIPKKGQVVCVSGIHRYDGENGHGWDEVHPVERWRLKRE